MYTILLSKKAYRLVKKFDSVEKKQFDRIVSVLEINPFDTQLKTHKLKGEKSDYYSCRLNFKERVLFILMINKEIVITDIGSHDQVY